MYLDIWSRDLDKSTYTLNSPRGAGLFEVRYHVAPL